MRRTIVLLAVSLFSLACGGQAAPADTTVRPQGTGWFCHGAQHAAYCARTAEECEALRVDTQLDPGEHPCEAHPQASCYTFMHPERGEHWRCFDSGQHCESSRSRCTEEETCSSCNPWD